ncbi:hypothetical protein ILYODFUR_030167 [Ilyodon furcidens]|uniref:Uncharacterized protein n=1 Tax=Ilyodon furcidens TaxID=33524 RepID=A0ABV0TE40_9TELE
MYKSSTSSTDIVVRHTIFHCCQESIAYPEKNVPSGQEGSPLPCLPIKKMRLIALRDQLTKSIVNKLGGYANRGSKKNIDKKLKQGKKWRRIKERVEKHLTPPRAEEEPLEKLVAKHTKTYIKSGERKGAKKLKKIPPAYIHGFTQTDLS